MLSSMRTLSKGIVSKLLMLLLIVSFAVWGVGDILNSSGPSYAAKVGSSTISIAEFQQQRQAMARQLEAIGMKELPPGKLEFTVIRQMITQKLGLLAMEDMGLYVNDELVGKSIANLEEMKDENGKFSKARFKYILDKQRVPEKVFVDQFRRDLAGNFLMDSLNMSDAVAPNSILTLQTLINGETRDAVLFTVPATDAMDESNTAAMQEYYEANKAEYMQPETRTIEYVVVSPSEIDALVNKSVTDELVEQSAAGRKDAPKAQIREQLKKDQRDTVMRDLSNTVEDELAAGKPIGEAFSKAGIKAEPRTITNATPAMKMSEDDVTRTVVEQGFTLSEGEISRLISSKQGTLLMVSAKKINPAAPKPFEEVKADVQQKLGKQLAADAARAKAVGVKMALAKEPNWQAVAATNKLATRVVSRVGRPVMGAGSVQNIPPALQLAMFERGVNEVAGPMAMPNGDQVLAYVTASHLPQVNAGDIKPSKETLAMGKILGRDIEGHAFQSFSDKHEVTINPQLMRDTAKEE